MVFLDTVLFTIDYVLIARADDDVVVNSWDDVRGLGKDGVVLSASHLLGMVPGITYDAGSAKTEENLQKLLSALKYWFPELCSLIVDRRIDALNTHAQHAKLLRKAAVKKNAIEDINQMGLPVTRRAVDRRIVSAGLALARPELRQHFLNLRDELATQ